MTESVIEFIKIYIPQMIGVGVGFGSLMAVIAILTGYSIKQALSFFDK